MNLSTDEPRIAVVIPCHRVARQLPGVIAAVGPEVGWILVVDDACPEGSGDVIAASCHDPRVSVLRHARNQGVGAAVLTGYAAALKTAAQVVVKLDGDGQMDPSMIPVLADPLLQGSADYAKGNRFYRVRDVAGMPTVRLIGNVLLSFLTKLSSGYWQLFDPTNGFTAIDRELLAQIDFTRVARRYFFESDMLYHLNLLRAVVVEVPMPASYGDAPSGLRPLHVLGPFLRGNLGNFVRRVLYSYFLRGFSVASVELALGVPLLLFGLVFGVDRWWRSVVDGVPATAGTVMLAALPLIVGVQFLLSWLAFDVAAEPRTPMRGLLRGSSRRDGE
ncbi:MAG TPA: glycosyltransferase family 2 protein [Rhodanobacteraceae bacterium]